MNNDADQKVNDTELVFDEKFSPRKVKNIAEQLTEVFDDSFDVPSFVEGARYQFNKLKPELEALRAENEKLDWKCWDLTRLECDAQAKLAKQAAVIEKCKEALNKIVGGLSEKGPRVIASEALAEVSKMMEGE